MPSNKSDAVDERESVAASPYLTLAIRRLAAACGVRRLAIVGPARLEIDAPELELVIARELDAAAVAASRDGLLVLSGRASWSGLDHARIVIAADLAPHGSALDAIAAARAEATSAGWHVTYSSLLHPNVESGGSPRHEGALAIACRPGDEFNHVLANGPLSLSLDPAVWGVERPESGARVLIASYEITGPTGNGGIGTAYHSLAHALAAAGHDVTLLFTGWLEPDAAAEEPVWRARFAARGIDFALLGTPWDTPVRSPHHAVRRAYEFHRWLYEQHAARPFDVVHLPETLGHGAIAQTAKAMGLAYEDVEFVIGTHSSTRWVAECNREGIEDVDLLATEQLERLSVARADVLLSPSAYLVDYMRDRGWSLPERTFVHPYSRPQSVRQLAEDRDDATPDDAPRELVFFGRLETRKGLEAFCDAVDVLVEDGDCPFERVTLLGRPERVLGEDSTAYVTRRAAVWGLDWKLLPDLGHDDAIAYLRETPCVVAIPSLVDNSPNTVIEVLALGVPFVASRAGGTGELIATTDLGTASFDGWRNATTLEPPTFADEEVPFDARALAEALRAKAADHATPAAPSADDIACDREYDRWHRAIAARPTPPRRSPSELPSAAVLIAGGDGDDVRRISEAIIAGSRPASRIAAITDDSEAQAPDDVALVHAAGREQGPARVRLVEQLDADVLVVLDGDSTPDSELVERVATAMAGSDADVVSLVVRDPDGDRETGVARDRRRRNVPADLQAFVPIHGPAIANAIYPALSVGAYAIRRTALTALNGYKRDMWGASIDRELLSRASLAGLRIAVLPEPVATAVRDDAWTEVRTRFLGSVPLPAPEGEEQIRLLRPFRRRMDATLGDMPALLVGALRSAGGVARFAREEERRRQDLVDAYETHLREYRELTALYESQKQEMREAIEAYERQGKEQRELIALYERQKEELRSDLRNAGGGNRMPQRVRHRLQRATRGSVKTWPGRGVRFARWRLELLRRKVR